MLSSDPKNTVYLGPSGYWTVVLALWNPCTYLTGFFVYIAVNPEKRVLLKKFVYACDLKKTAFAQWLLGFETVDIWVAAMLLLTLSILISALIWGAHSIVLHNTSRHLSVHSGIFFRTDDLISLAQVIDADITRSPLQSLCGTGTIKLTVVEQGNRQRTVRLGHINKPLWVRDALILNSSADNIGIIL